MHANVLVLATLVAAAASAASDTTMATSAAAASATAELSKCLTAAESLLSGLPTPPSALVSFAITQTQTNPCSVTFPASLKGDYSSYSSEFVSWYSHHIDDLKTVESDCPGVSSLLASVSNAPVCTASAAKVTSASAAASSASKAASSASKAASSASVAASSASKAASSSSKAAAAPRETGILAALAAAGLAVAAL